MAFESFLIGVAILATMILLLSLIMLVNDDYESMEIISDLWKDLLDKIYWLIYRIFHRK